MSFLRRLLGGEGQPGNGSKAKPPDSPVSQADVDEVERDREQELRRAEAGRLDDLARRQLKYADRSWTPPAQGGSVRAEDSDPERRGDTARPPEAGGPD